MKLELFAPTERPIRQRPHLRSDRLVETVTVPIFQSKEGARPRRIGDRAEIRRQIHNRNDIREY